MKSKVMLWLCALGICGTFALHAADVTGKWVGQVPTRGGETRDATFLFKQEGNKLTGSMTGREQELHLADGKVDGDTISFTVTVGGDVRILYKGAVSGNEIKFTREREGSGQPREFTARRAES